jgi:hypothetical protein
MLTCPNSITVSRDGKPDGAWRLPLTYTKTPRIGQPIVIVRLVGAGTPREDAMRA